MNAQSVSFTADQNLLESIGGFSSNDCSVDMNGDYLDDIVRVQSNGIYVDYQQQNGSFDHHYYPMSLANTPSWSICAGDLDGNGFTDLLFGAGNAVSFVMANADGTGFTEYANPDYIFSQRSTMSDIDLDGDLDAFVCHDVDLSHPYRNDGNGVMTEDQSLIHTVDLPGNYANIWVDYDNDGFTDLYITKCRGGSSSGNPARTNAMYKNNGDGTFTEVGESINMADNAQSWSTTFEDYDNDGDFDAFIVNHDFHNRFMLNDGTGVFTDIIDDTNIPKDDLGAWENASCDFNNDGFVDILAQMSQPLLINNGDLTFTGQSNPFSQGGIGDFNNDGFLDVVNGNTIYLNDGNDNNWIKINTLGIVSNKQGVGSRVEIYGDWGIQIREVRSGQSFSPMSSLCAHFGIGTSTSIDSIIVKWPSGVITKIEGPEINTSLDIVEAECVLEAATIGINGSDRLCAGETVELLAPGGFESLQWSTGGSNPTIEVSEAGSYGLYLYDAEGCVSVAQAVIIYENVDIIPTVSAVGDLTVCAGGSVILNTSDGENHVWSNGMTGQSIEVSEAGLYTVLIDGVCSEEAISSEIPVLFEVFEPINPELESIELDNGAALITATGENLQWYDAIEGGTLLGEGNTYQTTELLENTTFYVESHNQFGGGLQQGGKLTVDGDGGIPSVGAYSLFDAYEPFIILTVDVLVPADQQVGTRTIQLFDENDVMLNQVVIDLEMGLQTIELGFDVPEGSGLSLRCVENNIFRNNEGVSYPYAIGEVGAVTTSFYGETYYYYFYNWQVESENFICTSDRIAVEVSPVAINDLTEVSALRLFPNPATSKLSLELTLLENINLELNITNSLGQLIYKEQLSDLGIGAHLHSVDVSQLPAGIYQLQLSNNDHSATMKVVVE